MKPEDLYVLGILVSAAFNCYMCYLLTKSNYWLALIAAFLVGFLDKDVFESSLAGLFGTAAAMLGIIIGAKIKEAEKKKEDKESSSDKH